MFTLTITEIIIFVFSFDRNIFQCTVCGKNKAFKRYADRLLGACRIGFGDVCTCCRYLCCGGELNLRRIQPGNMFELGSSLSL